MNSNSSSTTNFTTAAATTTTTTTTTTTGAMSTASAINTNGFGLDTSAINGQSLKIDTSADLIARLGNNMSRSSTGGRSGESIPSPLSATTAASLNIQNISLHSALSHQQSLTQLNLQQQQHQQQQQQQQSAQFQLQHQHQTQIAMPDQLMGGEATSMHRRSGTGMNALANDNSLPIQSLKRRRASHQVGPSVPQYYDASSLASSANISVPTALSSIPGASTATIPLASPKFDLFGDIINGTAGSPSTASVAAAAAAAMMATSPLRALPTGVHDVSAATAAATTATDLSAILNIPTATTLPSTVANAHATSLQKMLTTDFMVSPAPNPTLPAGTSHFADANDQGDDDSGSDDESTGSGQGAAANGHLLGGAEYYDSENHLYQNSHQQQQHLLQYQHQADFGSSPPADSTSVKGRHVRHESQRAIHNATERERRRNLNGNFTDLGQLIPALRGARRPSKRRVIQEAIKFFQQVETWRDQMDAEMNRLRAENASLLRQIGGRRAGSVSYNGDGIDPHLHHQHQSQLQSLVAAATAASAAAEIGSSAQTTGSSASPSASDLGSTGMDGRHIQQHYGTGRHALHAQAYPHSVPRVRPHELGSGVIHQSDCPLSTVPNGHLPSSACQCLIPASDAGESRDHTQPQHRVQSGSTISGTSAALASSPLAQDAYDLLARDGFMPQQHRSLHSQQPPAHHGAHFTHLQAYHQPQSSQNYMHQQPGTNQFSTENHAAHQPVSTYHQHSQAQSGGASNASFQQSLTDVLNIFK
ncbi:hypothetical protein GQ42DRAFT_154517 [Ramicandelaber brevisporus]|nr:hypothetical protein GQ42DRAFT_154517 [Ramicandelaber brevisporus]